MFYLGVLIEEIRLKKTVGNIARVDWRVVIN